MARSEIWTYFKKEDKRVQCKLCPYSTSFKNNTSNLWTHFRNKHSTNLSRTDHDENLIESEMASTSTASQHSSMQSTPAAPQLKINEVFVSNRITTQKQEIITQLIAKMTCLDTLPTSFVENEGFKNLLSYVAPGYKIPTRKTISLRIDAMYEAEKEKLNAKLSASKYVAITTDCWSSRANESYITVTCHHIGNDWQHLSYNLTTELFDQSHTIFNLENRLLNIIEEWNIQEKCIAIVHDNASNIVGAARKLPYESVCCFAHSLQLVLNKVLDGSYFKTIISKCSSIVGHFKHSNKATSALQIRQNQLNLPNHKLIQSVRTRWNSTYYMLKRLTEQREAVIAVLFDRSVTGRAQAGQLVLSEDEWNKIEILVPILEPFELVTTLMSSETQPTFSMVMPIVSSLLNNFILKGSNEEDPELQGIKRTLHSEFKCRFKDFCVSDSVTGREEICSADISTFLDPRFKNKERFLGSIIKTKRHLHSILESMREAQDLTEEELHPEKKTILDIIFPNEQIATNEVDLYALECAINKDMCPLSWWRSNEGKYPTLSKIAKKYLCIPATSTPSERAFSKAGNIISAKRSCLKPDNVKKICFLSQNL